MSGTPLTVEQLIGRLDVKCDEIMMRSSRPTKGDVAALVSLCRKLIAALEERKNDEAVI